MPPGQYLHKQKSASVLFHARVEKSEAGCWNWLGSINRGGYGVVTVGGRNGAKLYAHRIAYELYVGPIPDGLDLDHLCRNRHCANPAHLEPVTRQVNTARGSAPALVAKINGTKTHCKAGHAFNDANTIWRRSGGRRCLACEQQRARSRSAQLEPV